MVNISLTKVQASLIIVLIVLSSAGTYAYWWYMQPKAFSTVFGMVHLDEPIVGATVSVYDSDGFQVFEKENATHTTGSFVINIAWGISRWDGSIPDDIKIVATGGTLGDEAFTGTLTRMVGNYTEDREGWAFYKLNAITTLIAAYMDAHTELDYAEAEDAVEQFLMVYSGFELAEVINHCEFYDEIFYHEEFMTQATFAGGFDVFIDQLVGEIEAGFGHPFYKEWGLGEGDWLEERDASQVTVDIVVDVGQSIIESAIHTAFSPNWLDVGADVLGLIMRLCGYEDPTSKRLREMDEKLNSILASILEIKQDIQKIKEMLVEIQNAIARLETTLKQHTVGGFAQTAIAKIEESYDFLGQISGCTYVSPETLTEFRNDILSTTSGVKYAMGLLHKLIMGEPGFGEGLLQIMTDSIIQDCTWRIPEYGDVFEEKVIWYFQSFEDFYSYLYLVQIQGIDLIMNAHYYRDESELVKSFLNEFQPKLEAQVEKYLSCVERLVFNVHPSPIDEFPNIGPIPDRAIALESVPRCEYYPNYHYNFTEAQKHLCQFLPRADYVVDRMLRGAGCFTARVLYDWGSLNSLADGNVQPSTYYGPFLRFVNNETMYMFDGHGSLSRPVEATYNRLWAGGVETPYGIVYYSRYKWTNIPVGNYTLWDPDPDTRLFTPGVSDGYTSTGLVCSYDWHDCHSLSGVNGYKLAYGVMLSRGDFLVVEHWEGHPPWDPLSLTPWAEYVYDNFIEVKYDKNGFPYGYWAGFWHQGINYDPMA